MIIVNKQPKENAVFLSTDEIIIEVESTLGADHYFKTFINVNDTLFDVNGSSRINNTKCIINLKDMFEYIFTNKFSKITDTGLVRLADLYKKINLTIKEYNREDDLEVNSKNINTFFVLHSEEQRIFNHTINLQKLSDLPNIVTLKNNTVFSIPFWLNTTTLSIKINDGDILVFREDFTDLTTGVFQFNINLSNYTFTSETITIEILSGLNKFTQIINFKNLTFYTPSSLYFKNNFGIFEHLQLFGNNANSTNYKRVKYTVEKNTEQISNVTKKVKFKINSGFLLKKDTSILTAINTSKELYYNLNGTYTSAIVVSKKTKGYNTADNYFNDYIELQLNGSKNSDLSHNYD